MGNTISGAEALARGAINAGVQLVTGYPGSPVTAVVNSILQLTTSEEIRVEWTSNEKVAAEMAFGASVAGERSLLCVKSVGLNIALDPLMTMNLSGCNAGFVILVGDDPGGWGSQNEQDSRILGTLAELPVLEPASTTEAYSIMQYAFHLSESKGLPVILRITRALTLGKMDTASLQYQDPVFSDHVSPDYQRESMRWVVLPVNVVSRHRDLLTKIDAVREAFETIPYNRIMGKGKTGVISAGFTHQKLLDALGGTIPAELRILCLGSVFPLPAELVAGFLATVETALVLEETAPLIEQAVKAIAQTTRQVTPIFGRESGHVERVGELFAAQITQSINKLLPALGLPTDGTHGRSLPSQEPLCAGCPYIPTFDALVEVMDETSGRDGFIVVGDPGCMVRAQLPPYQLLDVKTSLGASIGTAAGIAISQKEGNSKHVVALCGDSSFLHTGFNGLVDAVRVGADMLVVVLDNGTTALSGGQPHPGSQTGARGEQKQEVDLVGLARQTGAPYVDLVDIDQGEEIGSSIKAAMSIEGTSVIIARGECVFYDLSPGGEGRNHKNF